MGSEDEIGRVVRRARRRLWLNEVLAQSTLAASVALGGAILVLLLGTQLLDWRVVAGLCAVAAAIALGRVSRRLPDSYRAAQLVDARLALADSLSTAWFFCTAKRPLAVSASMREAQLAQAQRRSAQIDSKAAIPLVLPRAVYALGGLFLGAATLFFLRYGIERRIDLRAPLAQVLYDAFGGRYDKQAALKKKNRGRKSPDGTTPVGIALEQKDPESQGKLDAAPDSVLDTVDTPDVNKAGAESDSSRPKQGSSGSESRDGEKIDEGTESSDGSTGQPSSSGSKDERAGNRQSDGSPGQQPGTPGENSSLASKIRDAMANLLSGMRPQNGGAKQPSPNGHGQQSKSEQASAGQKGAMGKGQKQPGGEQSADAQQGDSAEDSEGKSAEGASNGTSSDQQASRQPGSGIGRQDGAKDARLAEQLAAMGKISEIIGKRSANVTGEATVEVSSTRQQLRTPYADSRAQHGEAGGEINRDEVPVAFQHYVQQYFERVLKAPPPAAK